VGAERWRGGGQRWGRNGGGRARIDLEDPEPQDAVGDPEVVVELVEHAALALEPKQPVVGLGALADLIGELAHPPRGVVLERAAGLDPFARVGRDLLAACIGRIRIEHQNELVFPGHCGSQSGGRL
jgi:hypothetical protein